MLVAPWSPFSLLWLFLTGVLCSACAPRTAGELDQPALSGAPAVPAAPAALALPKALASVTQGDPARGRELVQHFECNRCHEGPLLAAAPLAKSCFSCHEQILRGTFPVSSAALARFRPHVASAREAPSLTALGARLDKRWVVDYLLAPRDLRPKLTPSMPRLAIDETQASDIVAYLTAEPAVDTVPPAARGDATRGRELMERKGCSSCHAFSGVPPFIESEAPPASSDAARAAALAPDLRFTRDRFRRDQLTGFLLHPKAIKPDTRMPDFDLSLDEAADIGSYVLFAALAPEPVPRFVRLPLLTRKVSFDEVNVRVFSRTCHHCHTDAESAGGDGGPGNTGGFGFAPRGVSFSSHASILAGYLDAKGERRSLFEPSADGTPRLVAALLARHDEVRSAPRDDVRGMPLALPALPAEDIQLVESWVAQGKPL